MACSWSLVAVAVLAVAPWPLLAQGAGVDELAQLLALEDRREFNGALLQRLAQHPDSTVRSRAAMTLGRLKDPGGLPLLLQLLADRDSLVRAEAAFALGSLGNAGAVPELARLVDRFPQTTSGAVEIEVVTALCKIGGPEADRALDRLLARHPPGADTSDAATATLLEQSFRLGRGSAVVRRLPDYVRLAQGTWKRSATYAATRLRLPEAASALLDAARDGDALTRSYVARGLTAGVADSGRVGREAFVALLRMLIGDDDAGVRINALRALATFADSSLAPLAISRLVDRDPNVPVLAAATVGSLGGSRAAATLAERVPAVQTLALRRAMFLALARVSPQAALEASRSLRAEPDWRWRAVLAELLGVAATPAAVQQLKELVRDQDARVVAAALGALAQAVPAGDSVLVALAERSLTHEDFGVRTAAVELIGRERSVSSVPELVAAYRRAESDELSDARLAVVHALAGIAETGPAERSRVEAAFLAVLPRSQDYLVRRAVAERFGEATHRRYWAGVLPVETGRSPEEYRDLARRYLLGQAPVPTVTIETERGNLVLALYPVEAPLTVDNFLRLVDRRFFDNGRWHRVVPNFVVQDGDPRGDGNGGPGTMIRDEINRHRYDRGAVGMALSGADTGGSQFFITHSPQPHLDGGYSVFGHVSSGWNVLDQIVQGDRIRRIFR